MSGPLVPETFGRAAGRVRRAAPNREDSETRAAQGELSVASQGPRGSETRKAT
jgi:hypothetical protein